MNAYIAKSGLKTYCNCLARERGLDPVGHAGHFDDAIVIEAPLPWKRDIMQTAGVLPQAMIDLLALWLQAYYAGEGYPHLPLVIAPDPEYSREGFRRVMFFSRPAGAFACFNKAEYLVPVDDLGELIWSLYQDRAALSRFEPYRVSGAHKVRDILVCTHGSVDAACAKFGYPLYKFMRDTYATDELRVWRVSHFGGHVFAPTVMDMPTGHYWAYVGNNQASQIIRRDGEVALLRAHYRGWAGLTDGFLQAAECELWQQYGWQWFEIARQGNIVAQEGDTANPKWAEVQITYSLPHSSSECSSNIKVKIYRQIETIVTTGEKHLYAYPQYRVVPINPQAL